MDQEVAVVADRRQHVVLGITASCREGVMHAVGQRRAEVGIILAIEPEHGYPRSLSESRGRLDQLVGRAVVVWLAADAPAAPCRKDDDGANGRRVRARERD